MESFCVQVCITLRPNFKGLVTSKKLILCVVQMAAFTRLWVLKDTSEVLFLHPFTIKTTLTSLLSLYRSWANKGTTQRHTTNKFTNILTLADVQNVLWISRGQRGSCLLPASVFWLNAPNSKWTKCDIVRGETTLDTNTTLLWVRVSQLF